MARKLVKSLFIIKIIAEFVLFTLSIFLLSSPQNLFILNAPRICDNLFASHPNSRRFSVLTIAARRQKLTCTRR